jgi:hypothetical protein
MNCILLTTGSDASKVGILKKSLDNHKWPYHFIIHKWKGFGDKILETYAYLKSHPEITHFFYSDSYDTIVTGTMEEALNLVRDHEKILMSAERACYPHPDKASMYPECDSPFKYVNGGGWFCPAKLFIHAVETNPLTVDTNDQVWFTDLFLDHPEYVNLDTGCTVFQTIAFCPEDNFEITDKVANMITQSHPIFIHGNGHTPLNKFYKTMIKTETLKDLQESWADQPEIHQAIFDELIKKTNGEAKLKALRDYIEENIFGFGERAFYYLFKLITKEHPVDLNFLEIGVFRGQTLALMRLLNPKARITGITPLDSTDGHWESDYANDIETLHRAFKLKQPRIIKGLSTDPEVIAEASKETFDMIYIDGGHSYEVAKNDVYKYSSLVKIGGHLIIDDCCNRYNLPEGMFKGIETVSKAVDELLPNDYYKEICSVGHIRVFERVK